MRVQVGVGAELACEVAAAGHLDLDDLGAQQRELVGAERPGEHVRQVEDADPCPALCSSSSGLSQLQRRTKGLGTSRSDEIQTHFVCRYSLMASVPDSRPMPDSL